MEKSPNQVTILVIDEKRAEREKLEHELHVVDFRFRSIACDGTLDALSHCLAQNPAIDVVLCPFSLPGVNALQMLQTVRSCGFNVPFVLLAFDLSEDIAIELLDAGMEDYIQRTSLKRLSVVIRKALQRHLIAKELEISRQKTHSSEMALRSMVRNMPMPVVMLDRELRLIVASELWMKLTNNEGDDLAGSLYHELIPNQPEHWKKVQQQALAGESFVNDGEKFTFHGNDYWTRWKINPWYDSEGNVGGLVVFSEDITKDKQLQSLLELSEASLKDAQQLAKMGSWEWEVGAPSAWASEELHRQFGEGGASGPVDLMKVLERVHPDDRAEMMKRMAKTDYRAETVIFEFRYSTPSGQDKILVSRTVVSDTKEGSAIKLRGILQDVTKEREQERDKQGFSRLLDNVFASVPDALIYVDSDLQVRWVSESVRRVFGYGPEELLGDTTQKLYLNAAEYQISRNDAFSKGSLYETKVVHRKYRRKDGTIFDGETTAVTVLMADGSVQGFLGSTRDMTERVRLESRLAENEQLFHDMSQSISEVFWLTDYQANRILYMSPQYEALYGMSVKSVYQNPTSWSLNIHPEDRPGMVEAFRTKAPLGAYDVEYRIIHPDGRTIWIRDRAFPICGENGEVLRIAGISQDITKEKSAGA